MSLEDFKNIADGVQSLIVSIGVLIGGAWALFRFRTLKDIEKARADLEKLKRDLLERGHLKVQMEASQFDAPDGSVQYINIILTITNVGNRTEIIRWLDSKVGAALVVRDDGSVRLGPEIRAQIISLYMNLSASTIDPGNTEQYGFLVPIENVGTYFLEPLIVGSPEEMTTTKKKVQSVGIQASEYVAAWGGSMYFHVVKKSPNNIQPDASIA